MLTTTLRVAARADRPALERLWLMFRHDLSEFRDVLPRPDGTFRDERLVAALTDPNWVAYLLECGDRPVGFALVRGLADDIRVLSSFFVVRGARRQGIGVQVVPRLVGRYPRQMGSRLSTRQPRRIAILAPRRYRDCR